MRNFIFLTITLFFCHFSNAQTLKFTLSDYTLLPKKPEGILHGISGIEYIPSKSQWHLASDRGNYFIFDSIKTIHDFEKRQAAAISKKTGYWFEAIRYDPRSETFLFAVENEYKPNKETCDTTTYVSYSDSFPPTYLIDPLPLPTDNKGIEAIAVTENGSVWVAPEAGWADETEVGYDTIHFRKFERVNSGYTETGVYTYLIDRSGCPHSSTEKRGGISEILSLGEDQMLVLERCFDQKVTDKIKAKLWQVTVEGQHLKKDAIPAFDFNDSFPLEVDNLEGMAWWPGEEGKREVLLITDDNPGLKNKQRTQLILLKEK
ncbi:esterase-like activity of phytase family protein [Dyadobacter sp. LHD-138]|uniref:esterase-like activity of phytase family protein n=1 Tax=Dyadobacter sp. LHD-138 TaxID=3071413 RepID=UPI0027E1506F|nr:esterase-like activity of phytase family protein [Dyadobacter sp. LHD-138]MDQ6480617.1 esterase-like activity of phytase family protein [Dyadobacter sp. LHD-138]